MQNIDFPLPLLIGGLIAGALCIAATAIFHLSILPSVNQRLSEKERIPVYATDWNLFFVLRKHKEIHPVSKLRETMYALFIGAGATLFMTLLFTRTHALRGCARDKTAVIA
jgi:hypothetical protein